MNQMYQLMLFTINLHNGNIDDGRDHGIVVQPQPRATGSAVVGVGRGCTRMDHGCIGISKFLSFGWICIYVICCIDVLSFACDILMFCDCSFGLVQGLLDVLPLVRIDMELKTWL